MLKRTFDLLGVLVLAIPALVLGAAIGAIVKFTSPGPVLHWSRRIGAHGIVFEMPKFRTMRIDTPDVATHLLEKPEQWLTPPGSFLRRTSLDEIPQLLSVLSSDMSLVGPRPALHNQSDLIAARHTCGVDRLRPGITGWAQVNGRDEVGIAEKVEFDRQYLLNHSLPFDLKILFMTMAQVLRRKGVTH